MVDLVSTGEKTIITDEHRHHGLSGSDAAFLNGSFTQQADRHILEATLTGQRHLMDVVHDKTRESERAVHESELRVSKDVLREHQVTRDMVREEASRTREMITSNEMSRLRDKVNSQDGLIVQLRTKAGLPI